MKHNMKREESVELGSDDEVEIVDGPPTATIEFFSNMSAKRKSSSTGVHDDEDKDDIEIAGYFAYKHQLPHIRVDCQMYLYPKGASDSEPPSPSKVRLPEALRYCGKCYCYICDDFAFKCIKWKQHCTAHPLCPKNCAQRKYAMTDRKIKAKAVSRAAASSGKHE
jgi:hypothetical protein